MKEKYGTSKFIQEKFGIHKFAGEKYGPITTEIYPHKPRGNNICHS
jgi:hypothetical protein